MTDPLHVERRGKPIDLEGLWSPNPAFLVGSGTSLNDYALWKLKDRGVMSLAVNNAAAWAPVRAWCFSDPQSKFHHGLFLDPAIMTFAPVPKLKRKIRVKLEDGWHYTTVRVRDCPSTYGYERSGRFVPATFFDTEFAHWGAGKRQPADVPMPGGFCTVFLGLRLLHYLGVRRVYLLGVDHQKGPDGVYAFPENKKGRKRFRKEAGMWESLLPAMRGHGVEVFNCNPDGGFGLFAHVPFDEAVEDCKGGVPAEPLDTVGWYSKKTVEAMCKARDVFTPEHF